MPEFFSFPLTDDPYDPCTRRFYDVIALFLLV